MSRHERTIKKHERIRELFRKKYLEQPRVNGVKKFTKEYIIAIIAAEFWLSCRQVENIIYSKPKASAAPEPAAAATSLAA